MWITWTNICFQLSYDQTFLESEMIDKDRVDVEKWTDGHKLPLFHVGVLKILESLSAIGMIWPISLKTLFIIFKENKIECLFVGKQEL